MNNNKKSQRKRAGRKNEQSMITGCCLNQCINISIMNRLGSKKTCIDRYIQNLIQRYTAS